MDVPEIRYPPECLRELVAGELTFRSSCDFRLTQADLQKACTELKETDEEREIKIQKLRDVLTKDKDFTYRTDDAYLLRYLRYRKFSCKEAYKHLRNLYTIRKEHPELYDACERMESLINMRVGVWLPYADEKGNHIFIIKLSNWRPSELNIRDLLPLFNLICDLATMNPHSQIDGVVDIFDLSGIGLDHASQIIRPMMLRLLRMVMLEVYPWRISRIILYNCSALQYAFIQTIRSVVKKKIADRFIVLRSDPSQLHEYVNPSLLPKEYGGSLDDDECYSFLDKVMLGNVKYLEYEHSFIGSKKP